MTVYPLLVGSGGKKFIEATGGTIFQQTIDSITYNVHRFDPGTSGDFVITFAPGGATVDVIMWGAAGGRSGSGARSRWVGQSIVPEPISGRKTVPVGLF